MYVFSLRLIFSQTMGLVIHGDSRLQMSIRVVPNENMNGFNKLRDELYIPIFWGYKVGFKLMLK